MWDAMGYNAGIKYDKHTGVVNATSHTAQLITCISNTGQLIGYADDWNFGLCVQQFANKVNVLTVVSPQHNIKIKFPIAHFHVNVLTRYYALFSDYFMLLSEFCLNNKCMLL